MKQGSPLAPAQRIALALLWLALLLLAGGLISQRLQLSGDLRKFMPRRSKTPLTKRPQAVATAENRHMRVFCVSIGAGKLL